MNWKKILSLGLVMAMGLSLSLSEPVIAETADAVQTETETVQSGGEDSTEAETTETALEAVETTEAAETTEAVETTEDTETTKADEKQSGELEDEEVVDAAGAGTNYSQVVSAYNNIRTIYTVQTPSGGDLTNELAAYLDDNCKGLSSPVMIYIPSGNYTVGDHNNLVLHSKVYIVAEGNTVITKSGGTYSMLRTRNEEAAADILIYGGVWNGNGKGKHVIEFNSVSNSSVVNVVAQGAGEGNGLGITSSTGINVSNSTFQNNGKIGVQVTSNSSATLTGVNANNNRAFGIGVDTSSSANITGGSASGNNDNGISISQSTSAIANIRVEGSTGHGLSASSGSNVSVTGSTVVNNKEYGICIADSALNTAIGGDQNNTITGNYWSGVSTTGSSTKINLVKNVINGNGTHPKSSSDGKIGHGIGVSEKATASIANNTIQNNSQCGISIFDNSSAVITSNNIDSNGRHGIGARQNIKLTLDGNNTVNANQYNGILASDNTTASITGAAITGNASIGVSVVDKSKVTLSRCTVSDSSKSNISVSKGDEKKTGAYVKLLSGNTISGSKKEHGIVLADKTTLRISGSSNRIASNKKNGISVSGGSKAEISGSTEISGNRENGIYVKEGQATLSKLNVTGNGKYGIGADKKAKLTLTGSTIEKNKNYGINIAGSGTTATVKTTNVKENKKTGIMVNTKAVVNEFYKNKVEKNGDNGIYVKGGSNVKKMQKNTITGHSQYGLAIYSATANNVKNNTFSNPKAKAEIRKNGAKSNISETKVVSIGKIKASSKKVTGKAFKNSAITVKAGNKSYKGKAKSNGKYSINISKQKKGTSVKVTAADKSKNNFYNTYVVK